MAHEKNEMDKTLLAISDSNSQALRDIASIALRLAEDLEKIEPSYTLAVAAGVRNKSYDTVCFGRIASFEGEAILTMADGRKWRCVGYGPVGGCDWIRSHGGITFSLLGGFDQAR
jgi:hypothetical protein